jgi:hypothetical protein
MSDKPEGALEATTRSLDAALETLRQQQERIRDLERRNAQLELAVALYQYRRPRGRPKAKKAELNRRTTGRPPSWPAGFDRWMYEAVIAQKARTNGTTKDAIESVIRRLAPNAREREVRQELLAIQKLISRYKNSQSTD